MLASYLCRKRHLLAGLSFALLSVFPTLGQTAFLDFNVPGEYTNNFSAWNDIGGGNNGGTYAFAENPAAGVGGSGAVAVINSSDTTATYSSGSWNFSTNGSTITVSLLLYTDGQTSGNKVQLGVINSTTNGLNANAGVAFASYRFIPQSATTWQLYEQYRSGGAMTTSPSLGAVTVQTGHWYKFVLSLTNTSGASGNYSTACALYDYGATGLSPGTNLITFSTLASHTAQEIATDTAVWPALRAFQNAGISTWDNFLVYASNSPPVMTLSLTNVTVAPANPATLSVLADGPGSISYAWYTNRTKVIAATNSVYTTPLLTPAYTNVMVVASNSNGSVTNLATITLGTNLVPLSLTGFNRDIVIENTAPAPPYTAFAQEYNPGEGTCFYQSGLTNTSYGLPASGSFASVIDGTIFQFQPYTTNNALVLSSETGISSGTLTLAVPATYLSLSLIANSASASPTSTGTLTIQFADGSSFVTNYDAADWFFNPGFALQGVDRININSGGTGGGPNDPRFYQTTLDLVALFGATNKPIAALTFGQAPNAGATAIYAVSGLLGPATNVFYLATVTNLPPTAIQTTSATLNGQVLANGGDVPNVTFYFGPTDGGTNPANWSNSIPMGTQNGVFSQTISGLTASATYYYTVQSQNYAGTSWATSSRSFFTATATPPQVINAPATGVAATFATLNGQVVSTGGQPAGVVLYYGASDGGTNPAAWASSVALGQQTAAFAQTVLGLSPNTAYFFTAQATNATAAAWAVPSQSFTTIASNPISTGVAVLTYHNDNTRQGLNANETALTLANVNTNTFGKLFADSVDGFVYAQPLIMTNVPILGKGTHNVVFIATEHNSVYAFDADSNQGANATPLWQVSFINPAAGVTTVPNGDVGSTDITPEVGITATPVIDPVTGTLYVEVKTKEVTGGVASYVHRLHALDITSGAERTNGIVANSPVIIDAVNYPGTGQGGSDTDGSGHVLFNGLKEHSRPALTLLNGKVYIAYASHGDNTPYHGWLFAYDALTLTQTSVYNTTPYGGLGGFWDGGGGATVDADGYLYLQTGNGTFDAVGATFSQASNNFAMAVLKFAVTNGIQLVDYFAPSNAVSLSGSDQDLGASAPIVLPDSAGSTTHRHLLVGGGKTAPIYVMDRSNLGQFGCTTCPNNLVQQFNGGPGGDRDTTPAFFNNTLYIMGQNGAISAFSINNGVFNTTPVQSPDTYGNKGGVTVCLSANGTNNGIAWTIANAGGQSPSTPCVLRAYNATNLTQELYASDQLPGRDSAGNAVKFTAPAIANGKVYVGGQYSLTVYGAAASFVATPTISPDGGSFATFLTVTLSDATPNATIYYTIDGTTPSTNSLLYSAPFVLTNTATVQAFAVAPGAVNSGIASAGFVNTSAIGSGTGLVGYYWSNVTSVAFTNIAFSVPPTLTRTDAVVNFNWTNTSPAPVISSNNFVVRWTGSVQPQFNETYTFSTYSDAGVRLWLNGQLLINKWSNQSPTTWTAAVPLVAQQRYNLTMEYFYQNQGGPVVALSWSSASTPQQIIPQSQLYPYSNPPPAVVLTSPINGAAATATATVTLAADADAPYNELSQVAFYANNTLWGIATGLPYALTVPGVGSGTYTLTAVATDASGLSSTSAPVMLTVTNGSGLPYGLTTLAATPAFYNMPGAFDGSAFGTLPQRLSQTGVFTNTPNMYAAGSLLSYVPNTPLWSDGAVKTRYLSVPNSGPPLSPNEQIAFAPTGYWTFPAGSVFVKTFQLQTNASDPNSLRRLETRLLVRDTNGAVYGVTYKWRPDNSDADLLTTSSNEDITITTTSGTITQTWYYPSPSDCLQCHTPVVNYVLGVNSRQLNGNNTYASGITDNQLRTLNRLGLFYPAIDEASIPTFERLSSITNTLASFEERTRSYLDANCAQCHQPGGNGPTFDARYDTPLTNQNLIYGALTQGNLGYDNAYVVVPKDIWRSILYDRMNTTDPASKMPPLARNTIDSNAVAVVAAWINSLAGTPAEPPPTIVPAGGTFPGSVTVTLQPPDTNAILYYTLDGSLPTTNSLPYTNPFLLTSSAQVSANAFETGFNNSVAARAQFIILNNLLFTFPSYPSGGPFTVQFTATVGNTYVLQASTDLINWLPVATNTPATSPFTWVDPGSTNYPMRFYRVLQLP
ncbi:MAG TPA: chitobiase/beta-hexosaminidase C-terminal domain-containing protein [Verrucomicrobiae bacterium]|nr:chitobiase/beta-hexosaminidase C-terminal domain-containing protein [Verrucomicrobiae bacterium]